MAVDIDGHYKLSRRTRVAMAIYRFSLECRTQLRLGGAFPGDSYLAIYKAVAAASGEPENGYAGGVLGKLTAGDAVEASEIEAAFLDLYTAGVLRLPDAAVFGMTLACLDGQRAAGTSLVPLLESLMAHSASALEVKLGDC